jgi:hypothetical protein
VLSVENEKISKTLFTIDFGMHSTYEHSHMPKINSSSVKICESSHLRLARVLPASCPRLARVLPASRPKILNCYPRRIVVKKNAHKINTIIREVLPRAGRTLVRIK